MAKKQFDRDELGKVQAFSHMRLKLLSESILNKTDNTHVIGLMSRTNGEGVTTCAAGLGLAIGARNPGTTLLIDANPLGRRLGDIFSSDITYFDPNIDGTSTSGIESCIVKGSVDVLSLTAQGTSQTCAHIEFNKYLEALKGQYDNIIIDIGSWNTESPLGWLDQLDGLILIIDGNVTTRDMLAHFKKTIDRCGLTLSGFFMNKHEKPVPDFIYKMIS